MGSRGANSGRSGSGDSVIAKNPITNRIENLLNDNGIQFTSETTPNADYLYIDNTYPTTRISVREFARSETLKDTAIIVEEWDSSGKTIYRKEFATVGKAFINRVKRNIG